MPIDEPEFDPSPAFLEQGGQMGALIRGHKWSETELGNPSAWPPALKILSGIMLGNPSPMLICWGSSFIQLYNDAFRPILGNNKHPQALGTGVSQTYSEIWDTLEPMFTSVMRGESVTFQDFKFIMDRNDYEEEVYFDFSYSPIKDENGLIRGVLVICKETTEKVHTLIALKETNRQLVIAKTADALAMKKAEESEERFRTMAEGTDIMIAVADESSNAVYFNRAWVELTGRPMAQLLEFGWADLIHPDEKEAWLDVYLGAFKQRLPFEGEFRVMGKNGDYRWLLAKGPPRFDQNGRFAGYISSCVDITERKLSEIALARTAEKLQSMNREMRSFNNELAVVNLELTNTQKNLEKALKDLSASESQLRDLVASSPFPIGVYTGREMRVFLANQNILDLWGKGDDVIGRLYSDILPELESQKIFKQLDDVFISGHPFHAHNQRIDLMTGEGFKTYYFNYSFTPLLNSAGEVYGVMNTAADVTDLNIAKQQVEQNASNLQSMILQAPVAMCILLGPEHVVAVANRLMIDLWGKEEATVLNRPVFDALPDARAQGLEAIMEKVYLTGETFTATEMPVRLVRNGKEEIIYQDFVYEPYRGADGVVLGVIAITIDVTERKLDDIRKNDFIGMVSHELKTPLTSMKGYIQMLLLKSRKQDDSFTTTSLEKANTQIGKMTNMINGFLNVSRLESGKIHIAPGYFDLALLLQEVKEEFAATTSTHSLFFDAADQIFVNADRDKIGQVIHNLISNAIKYSPAERNITITCRKVKNSAQMSIKDEGMGIKSEHLPRLFERYYRVEDDLMSSISGFGIGLYLCAEIIRRHHGEIWVESEFGKGSVFSFNLPLAAAPVL